MSNKHLWRAAQARPGSGTKHSILVKLALLADLSEKLGSQTMPSYKYIADQVQITRRQAMRLIRELIQDGYLSVRPRRYVREDGQRWNRTNVFSLMLDDSGRPTGGGDMGDTTPEPGGDIEFTTPKGGGDMEFTRNYPPRQEGKRGGIEGLDNREDVRGGIASEEDVPW